jgi:signal transduction histidine kinase
VRLGWSAAASRPTKPVTWPGWTVNDIPSSASTEPNRLRSPATSIVASMVTEARGRRCRQSSRGGAVFGTGASPLRGTGRIPGQGDAVGLACGDNDVYGDRMGLADRRDAARAGAGRRAAGAGRVGPGHHPGRALGAGDSAVLDAIWLCLLAFAGTVPLTFLRPVPAAVAITAASVLVLAAFGTPTVAGMAAQVIASYRLGRMGELRRAAGAGAPTSAQLLAAVAAVLFLVLALASRGSVAAILLASLVPAAAGTGIALRARAEAVQQRAARAVLADTLTEHLARGERARIARELHDVVAHHISMIAVQAETARLTTPGLPAAGAHRFAEIGDTARAGLTEMRRLLGVLREDVADAVGDRHPQPGLSQLASLIDSAREASGAGTRLIVSGPVASFDPGVELDNGPGPPAAAGGPGHGLPGMRERAATVGGSLRTGAAPGGGFLVAAVLPAKPEAT